MNHKLLRMIEEAGFEFTPDVMAKLPEFEKLVELENEACAKVCDDIARLYSTDIFPEDGTSVDCNSAKMGRVVTKNCAQSIRARGQHD